ncbi:MAG: hypothetical protein ACOYKA_07260 [Legionellaceae bacterium]
MHLVDVKQNEKIVIALDRPDISLTTGGVSTCICIMLKGRVGKMPYLAMYHWDGFDASFNKHASHAPSQAENELDDLILYFSVFILEEMKQFNKKNEEKPKLDAVYLFGGEHATEDVSGTELEVETLRTAGNEIFKKYFCMSKKTTWVQEHYLTQGDQSLRLYFNASGVTRSYVDDVDIEEYSMQGSRFH